MIYHLQHCIDRLLYGFLLAAVAPTGASAVGAEPPASPEALWKKLEPFAQPPEEFAGKLGTYRSPIQFADGSIAKSPADWARRREEIRTTWHKRLGAWPPLVEHPTIQKLEKTERDGYAEHKVQVQASPEGKWVDGSSEKRIAMMPVGKHGIHFFSPTSSNAASLFSPLLSSALSGVSACTLY